MNLELKKHLENFDALLISSYANIVYLTGFSGFSETERECFLLITENKQYVITDSRYALAIKENVKDFELIETSAVGFIQKDHSNILRDLRMKKMGIEENNLTVSEFKMLNKHIKKLGNLNLSNLRIVKRKEEIKNIKLACKITDDTFDFVIKKIKHGISEREIANQIELFIKDKNAEISFKPIVAFGKNSAIPHHQTGHSKLKTNQIILLDFGVKINNYCSDMSRTVFFGSASAEFKRIHKTVLEAQQKAIQYINSQWSMVNSKLLAKNIDKVARDYIVKQRFSNIIHSVGHGIGIEVHEAPHISPKSNDLIKENMIFSVEPGIYIPNYGGVRIEDLVLVRNGKAELISKANREIIEL